MASPARHLAATGVSAALLAACAAPQQPGLARTSYTSMATASGVVVSAALAVAACSVIGGGETTPRRLLRWCAVGGAALGAPAVLVGTLRADTEPHAGHWIGISIVPAVLVIGGVSWLSGRIFHPPP